MGFLIFLFFLGKGERGKGFRVTNVNWGFEGSASYQQVRGGGSMGVKVEFGGFIGGFGKIFFTKGGIKREKGGLEGWRNLYFFKNFQKVQKKRRARKLSFFFFLVER